MGTSGKRKGRVCGMRIMKRGLALLLAGVLALADGLLAAEGAGAGAVGENQESAAS